MKCVENKLKNKHDFIDIYGKSYIFTYDRLLELIHIYQNKFLSQL